MKNFLNNLDRKAGRWLEAVDRELQQPVVRAMTFDVLANAPVHADRRETSAPERAAAPSAPAVARTPSGDGSAARCSEAW